MDDDKIFIVLTRTGTLFSKFIRAYTEEEYNHVSISFNSDLSTMYSMSRGSHYNPLSGVLKRESPYYSYLKYYENTKCLILSLTVEPSKKIEIQSCLEDMLSKNIRYNVLGLFSQIVGVSYERDTHYFCSEFVDVLLKMNGIDLFRKQSSLVRPADFKAVKSFNIEYEGYIRDYSFLNREERLLYDQRSCSRYGQAKFRVLQGVIRISQK